LFHLPHLLLPPPPLLDPLLSLSLSPLRLSSERMVFNIMSPLARDRRQASIAIRETTEPSLELSAKVLIASSALLTLSLMTGLDVLDLYSGSGGFSLNSLAGGAKSVTLVESSHAAIQTIRNNLSTNNFSSPEQIFTLFDLLSPSGLFPCLCPCPPCPLH
jgi:2-polyprenyl-3-methyl-5-hydroxy-6-metoxy-1,4-benzoquinol methylase